MAEPIHILSLGAGVQSSTMALMAAAGEITPMPKAAIFADTQAEPKSVYVWLDWLENQLPFPVIRATNGSLEEKSLVVRLSKNGIRYTKHAIPCFITDGIKTGIMMRQCTGGFKLEVIHRESRKLCGRGGSVIMWIGISMDEIIRMKPSRKNYITHRFPLIDANLRRDACLRWMKTHSFKQPPRSACVFCPYHNDQEWLRLKTNEPQEFARAVKYETDFQEALTRVPTIRGTPYLHRECRPLAEIDFAARIAKAKGEDMMDLFSDDMAGECEGMCGV